MATKNSSKSSSKASTPHKAKAEHKAKPESKSSAKASPDKKVEKILEQGLDSAVEYAYEDDSKDTNAKKGDKKDGKKELKPAPKVVANGVLVAVEYVGKLKNGEEFDNSKNHGPIQFVVGTGQVIPGFDKAVIGMKTGDKKKFTIAKADAYGDPNPELVQVIPLSKVPDHIKSQLKVGGFLVMQSPVGQQVPAKVVKLDKDNVSLDMNHPLAGQDLTFEIKVVNIANAPEHDDCDCSDCKDDSCGPSCGCGH